MSDKLNANRLTGCICELNNVGEPVVAGYDMCPVHSGKRREVIENILFASGKLNQYECSELADEILVKTNEVQ